MMTVHPLDDSDDSVSLIITLTHLHTTPHIIANTYTIPLPFPLVVSIKFPLDFPPGSPRFGSSCHRCPYQ